MSALAELMREYMDDFMPERIDHLVLKTELVVKMLPKVELEAVVKELEEVPEEAPEIDVEESSEEEEEFVPSPRPARPYKSFNTKLAGLKRSKICAIKRVKRIQAEIDEKMEKYHEAGPYEQHCIKRDITGYLKERLANANKAVTLANDAITAAIRKEKKFASRRKGK